MSENDPMARITIPALDQLTKDVRRLEQKFDAFYKESCEIMFDIGQRLSKDVAIDLKGEIADLEAQGKEREAQRRPYIDPEKEREAQRLNEEQGLA